MGIVEYVHILQFNRTYKQLQKKRFQEVVGNIIINLIIIMQNKLMQ